MTYCIERHTEFTSKEKNYNIAYVNFPPVSSRRVCNMCGGGTMA
jgi:hypothetical protein